MINQQCYHLILVHERSNLSGGSNLAVWPFFEKTLNTVFSSGAVSFGDTVCFKPCWVTILWKATKQYFDSVLDLFVFDTFYIGVKCFLSVWYSTSACMCGSTTANP